MNDDTNSPMMPPLPAKPAHRPIARGFSSGGKLEVITDKVTGMIIAAPAPATMRARIITPTLGAKAAASEANPNTPSPTTRTGLRPQRSPIAPIGRSSAASATV